MEPDVPGLLFDRHSAFLFDVVERIKQGKKALFYADNDRLEAIWTIIPVFVLAGLILYGLYTWTWKSR